MQLCTQVNIEIPIYRSRHIVLFWVFKGSKALGLMVLIEYEFTNNKV